MGLSLRPSAEARALLLLVLGLCCMPATTQRGPQFYFSNPQPQPARFVPSTFPQTGAGQYQNFFPPLHTAPGGFPPFRPPGQQPPGGSIQDPQQQYHLQGYHQQPGLQPSPFQLPPNTPGQAQPQHYSTFQTINPPTSHDQGQVAPPTFFQQQQNYQQFQNPHDPSSNFKKPSYNTATSPPAPRPQSFLDPITLSPSGFSGTASPRDPNNLRLLQGFPRNQPPGFVDQFATKNQPKRPGSNFESIRENPRTTLFSQPFPVDDGAHVSTYVDQRLEVDDTSTSDPKVNSQTTSIRQKERKPEAALRKKPGSRVQQGSRSNFIAGQRARPTELRNTKSSAQNDSYQSEELDNVSSTFSPRFRGRNRENRFQSTTTTTTSFPPTRSRGRFVPTTKSPNKLTHQLNSRPTKSPTIPKRFLISSTPEPGTEIDTSDVESGEILYDENYDHPKSSEITAQTQTTTNPSIIYNVTTFRYTTKKSKDAINDRGVANSTAKIIDETREQNSNSEEQFALEMPHNETSTAAPLQISDETVKTSEHLDESSESFETGSLLSAEKEGAISEENGSKPSHEDTGTTLYDDVINDTEIPDSFHWSTTSESPTNAEIEPTHEYLESNGTGAFEILTMNPQHALVEQDNFKGFVDSVLIDATEMPHTSPETIDETTKEPEEYVSMHSTSTMKRTPPTTPSLSEEKEEHSMEEAIVSVVTTKSVINGTSMIVTVPPALHVTGQMTPPTGSGESSENSSASPTESWVIVASVQTSRSVSGARFLPPIIRQEERILPISGKTTTTESPPKSVESGTTEESTTKSSLPHASTESIIDKLDRVQSELSSGILTGGEVQLEVLTEKSGITLKQMNMERTTDSPPITTTYKSPVFIRKFTPHRTTQPPRKSSEDPRTVQADEHSNIKPKPPGSRPIFSPKPGSSDDLLNRPQGDQPALPVTNSKLRSGIRSSSGRSTGINNSQNKVKLQDISSLLPSGYKPLPGASNETKPISIKDLLSNLKFEDVSALLPPGYNISNHENTTSPKPKEEATQVSSTTVKSNSIDALFEKSKQNDISALLPPGYKETHQEQPSTTVKPKGIESLLRKVTQDDISAFLPPGYVTQAKPHSTTEKPKGIETLFGKAKQDDIRSFLPPGYVTQAKSSPTTEKPKGLEAIFNKAKQEDISAFLPPGFGTPTKESSSTANPKGVENILNGAKPVDISAFLPPGFQLSSTTEGTPSDEVVDKSNGESSSPESTTKSFKVKFPSVPGMSRRTTLRPTTTTKSFAAPKPSLAPIQKGWPTRATTEFTGWATPSTTPISIEKLLEAAKTATTSSSTSTTTTSTTTTTTTTTTPKPTTPGVCTIDCDLAATIKLVGNDQWVPELLDHNTREWQNLANEIQTQLHSVYSKSESLSPWYRKVTIDDFSKGSKGSVLVDYFVELTDLGRQINTQELKRLFHESLVENTSEIGSDPIMDDEMEVNDTAIYNNTDYASSENLQSLLKLGSFIVDPKYTDFIVVPKRQEPTVGYAEEDVFLPQWAIAGIVIGLASLLFVIIFGVTVLVNRHKNNKKKQPVPLTEDMLNELNKNHMGGLDNYAAEDLYNMEDVWNEKPYDKPPKKRSSASLQENSMSNLYDSWRSEWNGYYYNAYYGNGSSASGYTRRRSDYDTNF